MPSFKELKAAHDSAREIDSNVLTLLQAVSSAAHKPLPRDIQFGTGKFSTLGEFSLTKYFDLLGD